MGRISASPMVGALVVKNSRVIAEGHHHHASEMHAEIHVFYADG